MQTPFAMAIVAQKRGREHFAVAIHYPLPQLSLASASPILGF
jgi:hypothetical protein